MDGRQGARTTKFVKSEKKKGKLESFSSIHLRLAGTEGRKRGSKRSVFLPRNGDGSKTERSSAFFHDWEPGI